MMDRRAVFLRRRVCKSKVESKRAERNFSHRRFSHRLNANWKFLSQRFADWNFSEQRFHPKRRAANTGAEFRIPARSHRRLKRGVARAFYRAYRFGFWCRKSSAMARSGAPEYSATFWSAFLLPRANRFSGARIWRAFSGAGCGVRELQSPLTLLSKFQRGFVFWRSRFWRFCAARGFRPATASDNRRAAILRFPIRRI